MSTSSLAKSGVQGNLRRRLVSFQSDLTEIQCDMSDVNQQYEALGLALRGRQEQLSAMQEKMREVQEEASSMLKWLESKERTLSELEASTSPTKTETVRAQAEHNKVTALSWLGESPGLLP